MVENLREEQEEKRKQNIAENSEKDKEKDEKNPDLKIKIKSAERPKSRIKRNRLPKEGSEESSGDGRIIIQPAQIVDLSDPIDIDADLR